IATYVLGQAFTYGISQARDGKDLYLSFVYIPTSIEETITHTTTTTKPQKKTTTSGGDETKIHQLTWLQRASKGGYPLKIPMGGKRGMASAVLPIASTAKLALDPFSALMSSVAANSATTTTTTPATSTTTTAASTSSAATSNMALCFAGGMDECMYAAHPSST